MKFLVLVAFLSLIYCFSSCKKEPSNFELLEPYIGKYNAVSWVLYPDSLNIPEHYIEITKNGRFILNVKGSPEDKRGKIEQVEQAESLDYEKRFNVKLQNEVHYFTLLINSDTIMKGLNPSQIDKYQSSIYFVKE